MIHDIPMICSPKMVCHPVVKDDENGADDTAGEAATEAKKKNKKKKEKKDPSIN